MVGNSVPSSIPRKSDVDLLSRSTISIQLDNELSRRVQAIKDYEDGQ